MTAENTGKTPASDNEQDNLSVESIEKIAQQVAKIMSQMAQQNQKDNPSDEGRNGSEAGAEARASEGAERPKTAKDFISKSTQTKTVAKSIPAEIPKGVPKAEEEVAAPAYNQDAIVDHILALTRDIDLQKKSAEAEALKIREEIKAKEVEKQNQAKLAKYEDLIKNEKISNEKLLVSDDSVLDTMLKDLKILTNIRKTMPSVHFEPSKRPKMTDDQKSFRSLFEPEKSK